MTTVYKKRGSLHSGWIHSGWSIPLVVDDTALIIGVTLRFVPNDVVALDPYSGAFTGAIRILHTVEQYPKDIVFSFFGDVDDVLAAIKATGFRPNGLNAPPRLRTDPKFVPHSEFPARK